MCKCVDVLMGRCVNGQMSFVGHGFPPEAPACQSTRGRSRNLRDRSAFGGSEAAGRDYLRQ